MKRDIAKMYIHVSPKGLQALDDAEHVLRGIAGVRQRYRSGITRGRILERSLLLALPDLLAQGADSPLAKEIFQGVERAEGG